MCALKTDHNPGLLKSVLTDKCPRCRKGNLFVHRNPYRLATTMQMPEHCAVCGQKFELQTGFYFGTGYVSFALTVLFSMASAAMWWLLVGMGTHDNRVIWWLVINAGLLIILQPPLQRLSRSLWIAFFVRYDPHRAATAQQPAH